MNKTIKGIVLGILVFNSINAKTYTEKTYLQTRPFLSNLPMEYTTWHTQVNKSKIGSLGGSIQATAFIQESYNKTNLGKYFGYYAKNEGVIRSYIPVTKQESNALYDNDVIVNNIIHNHANNDNLKASGSFYLRPYQKTSGIRFDYYQTLEDFFLKISSPLIHINSGINPQVKSDLEKIRTTNNYGKTIMDFFNGNYEETTEENKQKKLAYAKIGNNRTKTGLGDIEIALGYNLYKKSKKHIKFGLNTTIPTGNKAKGEWLFEPIIGNGKRWSLGGFIDSELILLKQKEKRIQLLSAINLQFLFRNTEKRTLGLKNYIAEYPSTPLGHYYLAGENGQNALFPAANILTRDVQIKPQFQFEGLLGISSTSKNFSFDFGYNIFYKEEEDISLKEAWVDGKYALSNIAFNSSQPFNLNQNTFTGAGAIQSNHIDLEPAQSPSTITHKAYLGIGYSWNERENPVMFGFGGSYEFHNENNALEGLEVWLKSAISF